MSKKFANNLKQFRSSKNSGINPDSAWVLRNRALLLSQISKTVDVEKTKSHTSNSSFYESISKIMQIFVSKKILRFAQASFTTLLAISIAVGGWTTTVSAANDSLPGEVLYGVKMASEGTELLVNKMIGSEEDKVTTILKHASNRVDEFQRSKSSEQANIAIQSLKKKIESTGESLVRAEQKSPEEAMAIAKVVEEKTEKLLTSLLTESVNPLDQPADNTTIDTGVATKLLESQEDLKAEVIKTGNLIQATGIKAVEVLIQKVEQQEIGGEVMSKDEVKQTIARKLDQLVSDMSKLDVKIGEVSSSTIQLDIASSTPKVIEKEVKVSENTNLTSSTLQTPSEPKTNIEVVADLKAKVEVATQKVDEASKKAEEAVTQVGTLIGQNNLSAALEMVKELGGVKQEATAVVLEASNAVSGAIDVKQKEDIAVVQANAAIAASVTSSTVNTVQIPATTTPIAIISTSTISSTSTVIDKVDKR